MIEMATNDENTKHHTVFIIMWVPDIWHVYESGFTVL
jgi:hypothetical protein